jgi:hypothetical protein
MCRSTPMFHIVYTDNQSFLHPCTISGSPPPSDVDALISIIPAPARLPAHNGPCPRPTCRPLPLRVGDVGRRKLINRAFVRGRVPPVVAPGRARVSVAGDRAAAAPIGATVQQRTDAGAPDVVRCEGLYIRFLGASLRDALHRLSSAGHASTDRPCVSGTTADQASGHARRASSPRPAPLPESASSLAMYTSISAGPY